MVGWGSPWVAGARSVLSVEQRSTWEAGVLGMDSEERVERVVWGGLREGCLWEGVAVGGGGVWGMLFVE